MKLNPLFLLAALVSMLTIRVVDEEGPGGSDEATLDAAPIGYQNGPTPKDTGTAREPVQWNDLDAIEKIERLREGTLELAKALGNSANTQPVIDKLS